MGKRYIYIFCVPSTVLLAAEPPTYSRWFSDNQFKIEYWNLTRLFCNDKNELDVATTPSARKFLNLDELQRELSTLTHLDVLDVNVAASSWHFLGAPLVASLLFTSKAKTLFVDDSPLETTKRRLGLGLQIARHVKDLALAYRERFFANFIKLKKNRLKAKLHYKIKLLRGDQHTINYYLRGLPAYALRSDARTIRDTGFLWKRLIRENTQMASFLKSRNEAYMSLPNKTPPNQDFVLVTYDASFARLDFSQYVVDLGRQDSPNGSWTNRRKRVEEINQFLNLFLKHALTTSTNSLVLSVHPACEKPMLTEILSQLADYNPWVGAGDFLLESALCRGYVAFGNTSLVSHAAGLGVPALRVDYRTRIDSSRVRITMQSATQEELKVQTRLDSGYLPEAIRKTIDNFFAFIRFLDRKPDESELDLVTRAPSLDHLLTRFFS